MCGIPGSPKNLGTKGYRVPARQKFLVPMGTGYQPNFQLCRPLLTISKFSDRIWAPKIKNTNKSYLLEDIECIFSLKLNLNMFFDIFDDDNDARVTTTEIMEFGKKRNMQGLLPNNNFWLEESSFKPFNKRLEQTKECWTYPEFYLGALESRTTELLRKITINLLIKNALKKVWVNK